ncbi:hypothetical protein FZC84_01765 [Rossellomorea vietnamensis]|uniref:DUF4083 domain-containing protein n=2 Tax=Bacillales TaxID=1385 RepID=A0A5D4MIK5_9BACI|nr:hypothetical protein FZC84_01765 [Rossellomorea vietnamensis]
MKMYLLQADFNGGDIAFQVLMFILLLGVPAAILILIVVWLKGRNKRLDRIEEKMDLLLKDKE